MSSRFQSKCTQVEQLDSGGGPMTSGARTSIPGMLDNLRPDYSNTTATFQLCVVCGIVLSMVTYSYLLLHGG
jgi:hypothetical protein